MPMPNYGYNNTETKKHQDIVFEMAPEYVSDNEDDPIVIHGQKIKKKRGKVVTGKIGIDLERTMVINNEKNPDIWKTHVDEKELEEVKKYSTQGHKNLKAEVRKTLDSLISGSKVNSIKSERRPTVADGLPPSAEYNKVLRFSLPRDNRQSEESVTGVSIQPSGTYRLGSQPRNSLSPAKTLAPGQTKSPKTETIGQRVDPRYHDSNNSSRQSLSQAHYAKNIISDNPMGNNSAEYSYSQVSMKSFSAHGIRGLN
eukprot:TRINITY_DN19170_c0_g1_i2.p1 TRINITY_DN19170_c0_g1~~TRINITY_DN19170_c0_g1_i2.p1  ORF type:complete len:264 (-),score=32.68 TRINITY_DN19170_c0_g1_i2:545-1309(-)